jgi:epsin
LVIYALLSNLIDLTVDESQSWQLQPQFTALPPQMTTASYATSYDPSAVQAQFTAFDPYAQQAQYEAMLQAAYVQQQADAAAQQQQYYALQLQAAQLQASQQPSLVPQKTAFG